MAIEGSSSEYTRIDNREISKLKKTEDKGEDKRLQNPAQEYQLGQRKNLKLDGNQYRDKVDLSSPAPKSQEQSPGNSAVYERAEAAREQAKQRYQQQAQREIEQKELESRKADQQKQQNAEVAIKREVESRKEKQSVRKEEERELEKNQAEGPVKGPHEDPVRNLNLLA